MSNIFEPLYDQYLCSLLSKLPRSDITTLSRLPASRLAATALPNIGQIELVTSTAFSKDYDPLYVASFPKRPERESSDLIAIRLTAQLAGKRKGLAPYRIIGLRSQNGEVIGAAQFSVLLLPGGEWAVPYLQYLYVREQNRRQDMAEVLHTLVLAVAEADAVEADLSEQSHSRNNDADDEVADGTGRVGTVTGIENGLGHTRQRGRQVPFTLFETEPPGHGDDEASREYARQRASIHTKAGGVALVLKRETDEKVISAHVQPGLEEGDGPLSLVWVIRPSPALERVKDASHGYQISELGAKLVRAYYQSLRDEGFPEKNIRIAEEIVARREKGAKYSFMPLEDVLPNTNITTGSLE